MDNEKKKSIILITFTLIILVVITLFIVVNCTKTDELISVKINVREVYKPSVHRIRSHIY